MKLQPAILWGLFLVSRGIEATDYTFLNADTFVAQDKVFHFEADYGRVAPAKITTGDVFGTKMHYSEGNSALYFSHFLDKENALTWQVGANYTGLGWDENPRFTGNNYTYGIGSLTWISHALNHWRWVVNGGVAVDTYTFNFGRSAVYYSMLWGRYQHLEDLGIHIGFFAYYGAKNGYVLPILGLDYQFTPKLELKAVFPIDISLNYRFVRHWMTSLIFTSLGGPYRFPRKMHGGIGEFHNGVFKVYSTVLEWDLKFLQDDVFKIGAGAGWNFGGWIQTSTSDNHDKKYYHFNGAAYGRVYATLTF